MSINTTPTPTAAGAIHTSRGSCFSQASLPRRRRTQQAVSLQFPHRSPTHDPLSPRQRWRLLQLNKPQIFQIKQIIYIFSLCCVSEDKIIRLICLICGSYYCRDKARLVRWRICFLTSNSTHVVILSQSCHSVVTKPAVAGILKTKELYNSELARLCDTDRCSFVRLLCPHRRSTFFVLRSTFSNYYFSDLALRF